MPRIYNREGNILLELDLLIDERIDIERDRDDGANWIPFSFVLDVEGDKYDFVYERPCFTVWEIKKIVNGFSNIVQVMKLNPHRELFNERFSNFEHTCFEVFFDIEVYDADSDVVGIIIWINMPYLGHSGFKKGFDFCVTIKDFECFTKELEFELNNILSKYV